MKLENAKLHEEEIKKAFWKIWYDEKYQYYFNGNYRRDYSLNDDYGNYPRHEFAVLNDSDDLIGLIGYRYDTDVDVALDFGAINFTDDKITFALALKKVVSDIFEKYKANILEWRVVCGNPAEQAYDRLCRKLGGHVVGIRHGRVKDMKGSIHNEKIYELTDAEFANVTNIW